MNKHIRTVVEAGLQLPRSILDHSGEVLYSSVRTLRRGPVYLLGLNPGGSPMRVPVTVRRRLRELPRHDWNNYTVGWGGRPAGAHPLQRGIRFVAESLGLDLADICASNLIFTRSPDERSCGYPGAARACWPLHEAILGIVRPQMIVTFGRQPYYFLRAQLPEVRTLRSIPAGHGTWQCRAFRSASRVVVGLPHLSIYAIHRHPKVGAWLRRQLDSTSRTV
jgi:hypothetical protein